MYERSSKKIHEGSDNTGEKGNEQQYRRTIRLCHRQRRKVIARAHNSVKYLNDPTAHAEVVAIRKACKKLKSFQLTGCEIFSSCEPCPMRLGAIYWARPSHVYYSSTKLDAANAGFDDDFIYHQTDVDPAIRKIPFERYELPDGIKVLEEWKVKPDKFHY